MPKLVGAPTTQTTARVARTLLALYVAGDRGILVSDLLEQVGTSHATLYRVRQILLAAGWRISSEDETIDGVTFARWTIDAWQKLPKLGDGKATGPGRRPRENPQLERRRADR